MKPREYDKKKALRSGNVYFRRLGSSDFVSKEMFLNDIRDVIENRIVYHMPMEGVPPVGRITLAVKEWETYILRTAP